MKAQTYKYYTFKWNKFFKINNNIAEILREIQLYLLYSQRFKCQLLKCINFTLQSLPNN